MGLLRVKDSDVTFQPSAAGAVITAALFYYAARRPFDLTITSGSDGTHSGPLDPHHFGNAEDVRSHDLPPAIDPQQFVREVLGIIAVITGDSGGVAPCDSGWATEKFFGFLESPGTPNVHFHFQLRHGRSYPEPS